ncbi:hypothetical protein BB559_000173 [Furculomyces boomerangus]|uniref:Uncharacterized protein n=1 Tax=Furculomyces boomerangus TaxID=61424 RepID=A0A2T9Z679_9FUNG|nr:hypothetical protein BB559_000173 [Furculomyces boomerangus]
MNSFILLLITSLAMFVGSFIFGTIPLCFKLSEAKLIYTSLLGVGLLTGTALGVIIPEGIEAILKNTLESHSHSHTKEPPHHPQNKKRDSTFDSSENETIKKILNQDPITVEKHKHGSGWENFAIGVSLILGFLSMLILVITKSLIKVLMLYTFTKMVQLLEMIVLVKAILEIENSVDENNIGEPKSKEKSSKLLKEFENVKFLDLPTVFIGIFVHGMADGFALGAALVDSVDKSVGITVFLALILHKAPEAFGLVATLLQSGYDRYRIRKLLVLYSLCAPIGAILTNILLRIIVSLQNTIFNSDKDDSPTKENANTFLTVLSGYILLISGGMLLHVALCHALPEAIEMASSYNKNKKSTNIKHSRTSNDFNEDNEIFELENLKNSRETSESADFKIFNGAQKRGKVGVFEQYPSDSDFVSKSAKNTSSSDLSATFALEKSVSENYTNKKNKDWKQETVEERREMSIEDEKEYGEEKLSFVDLGILVVGLLFPLILTLGHVH